MGAYLVDNPPRIRQFRPRRASLWPIIGVHTAESYPDETGPDTGAENVARFIRDRTNYGSYHCLSDSDSRIELVPFDQAAYHIGTHGLNDRTIGISAATQAAKWNSLDEYYVNAMVRNMARDAADAARYIKRATGKTVPAKRITLAHALNGGAGFLAHGDADPDRRTDPGRTFPWSTFLAYYVAELGGGPTDPKDWLTMATQKEVEDALWNVLSRPISIAGATKSAVGKGEVPLYYLIRYAAAAWAEGRATRTDAYYAHHHASRANERAARIEVAVAAVEATLAADAEADTDAIVAAVREAIESIDVTLHVAPPPTPEPVEG